MGLQDIPARPSAAVLRWPFARRVVAAAMFIGPLCVGLQARAAEPDATERAVMDEMRPLYAEALKKTGSSLVPGSPAWEASLAKTASAFLAARPEDCPQVAWLAANCGARSLNTASGSMLPSLEIGDTFLAVPPDEARPLRRGDVVAFRDPRAKDAASATVYISRLIGFPGEHARLRDGFVEIDGRRIDRLGSGERIKVEDEDRLRFTERLADGRSYDIVRRAKPPDDTALLALQDDMPDMVVPPGHYFMLGDNRPNALDSRFASIGEGPGMPTDADIVGIVSLIYVSKDPARIGMRP